MRRDHGFSLIELAVVLVIIGLLLGGGIAALTTTSEQARRSEQREQFESIRSALYGFAMANGRLPCADNDYPSGSDLGKENYDGSECEDGAERGALPWATLGVGRRDAWGNVLYYEVTADPSAGPPVTDYADAANPEDSSFGLDAEGHLDVEDGNGEAVASAVPAVVVSFGAQGSQVWTADGFVCPTGAGFSDDERANCDNNDANRTFVDAGYRPADSPAGRFDDMLVWLSNSVLKARMVEAGKLP